MANYTEGPTKTFTSGEALEAFRRVKYTSSDTVVYSDAGEPWIGVTLEKVAITKPVNVRLRNAAGTFKMTASGACSVGDPLYGSADGKVDDVVNGESVGRCGWQAATADGEIIEVLPENAEEGEQIEVVGGAGDIAAGDLVYVSAQSDGVLTVLKAQGTSAGLFAAFVCPTAIAAAAKGPALKRHLLTGVNTNAGAVGDPVYLSDATAGSWTLTKPTAADKVQVIGRIVTKHASTGAILVDIESSFLTHNHTDASEGGGLTSPHITVGLEDANGAEAIDIAATTSAVDHVGVTNAAAGDNPSLKAKGDSTNVGLELGAKGTGPVQVTAPIVDKRTQTAATNTATLTIAQLLTKIIDGTPTAAATYTLPAAADLVAGIVDAKVGDSFEFLVNNKSAGANDITVAAGSGGTADGTLTVAQNVIRRFTIIVTNVTGSAEAYFVYGECA